MKQRLCLINKDTGYVVTCKDKNEYATILQFLGDDWKPCKIDLVSLKEPLIKDEKIRKAVRAWADANNIDKATCQEEIHCVTFETERGMFISFENADPIPPEGTYTVAELCGEEEE